MTETLMFTDYPAISIEKASDLAPKWALYLR